MTDTSGGRVPWGTCPPVETSVYNPLTKAKEDISKSPTYNRIICFLKEVTLKDNLALRMGRLGSGHVKYVIKASTEQALLEGRMTMAQLTRQDLKLDMGQKGVDMRLDPLEPPPFSITANELQHTSRGVSWLRCSVMRLWWASRRAAMRRRIPSLVFRISLFRCMCTLYWRTPRLHHLSLARLHDCKRGCICTPARDPP